jgi:hypothetical protein
VRRVSSMSSGRRKEMSMALVRSSLMSYDSLHLVLRRRRDLARYLGQGAPARTVAMSLP